MMAWSGKSCLGPAEISANLFLVQFKDGGRRISPIFHLFVADANERNRCRVASRSKVGMGIKFKDKIVLQSFRKVKC